MTKKSDEEKNRIRRVLKPQDEENIYDKLKLPKTSEQINAAQIAESYRGQGFDEGIQVSKSLWDAEDRRMHNFSEKWGVYIEHASNHRDNEKPFIAETDVGLLLMLRKILNANGVATSVRSITICRGEKDE